MMRKVVVRARALKDANVNFISIVDKGANRLPIRALKQEESPMINLNIARLFSAAKTEQTANTVGVIVKTSDAEGYAKALKAEGHKTVHILECESPEVRFVSLKAEGEVNLADAAMLATATHAVVLENGRKMFRDWGLDQSLSFAENAAANGFYSGVANAFDTAHSGIWDAMESAPTGERPEERVKEILDGLSEYIMTLVRNVPETAFKMERLVAVKEEEVPAPAPEAPTEATDPVTTTDPVEQDDSVTTDPVQEDEKETDSDVAPNAEDAPKAASVKSEDPLQLIATQLSTLMDAVNGFKNELTSVKDQVSTTATAVTSHGESLTEVMSRISKAEKVSQSALEATHGVVIGAADHLDDEVSNLPEVGQKSDRTRASNIEIY